MRVRVMKEYLLGVVIVLSCTLSANSVGDTIRKGGQLSALSIGDKGELVIVDEEVQFKPWSTAEFQDRVVFFQYMAARPSADKMNHHVNDALEVADFPEGSLLVTVVVNLDDVTFGASSWALRHLKKNKLTHPRAHLVADYEGKGLQHWQLKSGGSAIGVIDSDGVVLFFKEGKLDDTEVETVMSLIKDRIGA